MKKHPPISDGTKLEQNLDKLYEWFEYDPESGVLNNLAYGNVVGKTPRVLGDKVAKARLIWVLMTGEEPRGKFVLHKNGDKSDFRWENLMLSDRSVSPIQATKQDYQQHTLLQGIRATQLSDPEFMMRKAVDAAVSEMSSGGQSNAMIVEDAILQLADYALRMCVPRDAQMPSKDELEDDGIDEEYFNSRYNLVSQFDNPFKGN